MTERTRTADYQGKRLLDTREAATYCGVGIGTMREFGKKCGAIRRFGRRLLFDRLTLDQAIDRMAVGSGADNQ